MDSDCKLIKASLEAQLPKVFKESYNCFRFLFIDPGAGYELLSPKEWALRLGNEYYNPEMGEPIMNGGLVNWNLLALNRADEPNGKLSIDRFLQLKSIVYGLS